MDNETATWRRQNYRDYNGNLRTTSKAALNYGNGRNLHLHGNKYETVSFLHRLRLIMVIQICCKIFKY